MQAQKIVVIHPGSQNLRIGRASDLNPLTILHAVARIKQPNGNSYHDTLLPISLNNDKEILNEFECQRLQVQHTIQAQVPGHQLQQAKRMRVATPIQQIATFNRRSVPEILPDHHQACIKTEPNGQVKHIIQKENEKIEPVSNILFDRDILRLDKHKSNIYNVHFPMRRGELNLHKDIGGSIASVLTDLEAIWLYGFNCLGIASKSLPEYAAVLVIPDIYNRSHLRELVTLLLIRLRFGACFLLQDHVAATFGAGLGYACVVDVGDQKCSISCIEDGISQPDTRVRLSVGGGDVSQVFYTLLKKCCFPYKECDTILDYADAALIMQLKERYCHLSFELCGAQEQTFEVHKQGKHLRYTIQVGDECLVAPLSLFHTELLNITGKNKRVCIQLTSSQHTDAEDCFDAEYIRETGRRNGRDQMLEGTMPVTGEASEMDDVIIDAEDAKTSEKVELLYTMPNGQIIPLDQAIVRSIERCTTDEMKRKMYSCILIVGGLAKIPGLAKWLEKQINKHHNMEVNVFIKDMDPCIIAWKGACIMSCIESSHELWITGSEWEKHGIRILREKSPFLW